MRAPWLGRRLSLQGAFAALPVASVRADSCITGFCEYRLRELGLIKSAGTCTVAGAS